MLMEKLLRLGKRQLHTIVSREIIKPSSPTPSHRNPYNLSPIDLLAQRTFVPVILFFPNSDNRNLSAYDKARVLKESLSHSLTRYYPLSGRLPTPTTPYVDCNDEGVLFVEARNEHRLENFRHLNDHDEGFDQLFPDDHVFNSQGTNLMAIQLNHFACGGVGLAVSLSHLICDGRSIGSFLSHWASVARYGSTDHKEVQPFNPHILCHPAATSSLPELLSWQGYTNRVTKNFFFPNSKLNKLKNKVISLAAVGSTQPINNPTRVEVLTSLLYTSAVAAATKKFGSFKPSYLFMPMDIRNSFVRKLPQTAMGNFVSLMVVPTMDSSDVSLSMLVSGIKKEKLQLKGIQSVQQAADNVKIFQSRLTDVKWEDVMKRSYWCSSLCRFPSDKMDFGWGKPTGATFFLRSANCNAFLLMDTPDGDGIEAKAFLEKEEMEIFENDTEILSNCL